MLDQLWQADLHPNASRYDWMRASVDPETASIVWAVWVIVSVVSALAGLIILTAILSSKETRRETFNQYIIALVIPDIFFSGCCVITCALNWMSSSYYGGRAWCAWQAFYVIFGFAGSIWMHVVIAYEIRAMVYASHVQRAYTQPTLWRVLAQVTFIYALSIFLACMIFIPSFPIAENAIGGVACLPLANSMESEAFLWGVFLIPLLLLPLSIVGGFAYTARRLHTRLDERTEALFSFFSTILAVLVFMWVPSVALIWLLEPRGLMFWITFAGGVWSHLQGFVSATLYLRKPDVRNAAADLPMMHCLVGRWQRLANVFPVARLLADCLDSSVLSPAAARRTSARRRSGSSDWGSLPFVMPYQQADVDFVVYDKSPPRSDSGGAATEDVVNKSTIEADISTFLGHQGRSAKFELIFVENVQPSFYLTPRWFFGGLGPAFGHIAIAFTRPDGTRRLVNIVGGREAEGGREMVEFWERPYDYMYGCQGKAGIFARSMCIIRVQEWDPRGIEAIELYLSAMRASYRAARARWHNCSFLITLCSWLGPSEWRLNPSGNCSEWLSRGCFLAGLVRRPHIFPKAALVDLIEQFILEQPSERPWAEVVYLKQEAEACRARKWQRRTVWRSWTAPLHLLRNITYWDMEPFADAVVQVQRTESGELRATVEPGRKYRPRWARWLVRGHSPLILAMCAAWILHGWPREDRPLHAAVLARMFMALAFIVVNAVLY